jgi:rhomboid protease GluP
MSEEYKSEENTLDGIEQEEKRQEEFISFRLIQGKPYATWALIGLTAAVYLSQAISKWQFGVDMPMAYGAKISSYITYYHQYWRLITPVFLHASITHILFNMYALFTIGPSLENYYGHWDFLRFYLICGFSGNVLSHVAAPQTVSVGASTALFGLIGAQAMFLYKNRRILRNYRNALRNIGFVLVVNLLLGLGGGIDNWGHLGGLIGGLLLSWMCGPEIAFIFDEKTQKPVMVDTVKRSRREISYALVTIFFAAFAFALQGR